MFRVMIGSTQTIGTGVNVQDRIVAMHHIDIPWKPADFEQRNGRGLRQGNLVAEEYFNNEVDVRVYGVERSLDAYKFELLNIKQRFIDQVKNGAVTERVIDEGDGEDGGTFADFMATVSGNPIIKNKAINDKQVKILENSRNAFFAEKSKKQSQLNLQKKIIDSKKILLETLKDHQADVKESGILNDVHYQILVKGKSFEKVTDVGNAIMKSTAIPEKQFEAFKLSGKVSEAGIEPIATSGGFDLFVFNKSNVLGANDKYYSISRVKNGVRKYYSTEMMSDSPVFAARTIINWATNLSDKIDRANSLVEFIENFEMKRLESALLNLDVWPKEAEYKEALETQKEIAIQFNELAAKEKESGISDSLYEPIDFNEDVEMGSSGFNDEAPMFSLKSNTNNGPTYLSKKTPKKTDAVNEPKVKYGKSAVFNKTKSVGYDNVQSKDNPDNGLSQSEGYNPNPLPMSVTLVERQINKQGWMSLTGPDKITSSADVAYLFRHLEDAASENAFAVLMKPNGKYQVVYLGTGSTSGAVVDSKFIISAAMEFGAKGIVFVHNHPSGALKASAQDINMAKLLKAEFVDTGITVHDSVIINLDSGKYVTFNADSEVYIESKDNKSRDDKKVDVYAFDKQIIHDKSFNDNVITSSSDVPKILTRLKRGSNPRYSILVLNRRNAVVKAVLLGKDITMEQLQKEIIYQINRYGDSGILHVNGIENMSMADARAIAGKFRNKQTRLLDIVIGEQHPDISYAYKSLADQGFMEGKVEYKKSLPKTININGKERPTTNNLGKPIAQSEQAIRNFYEWFGDSKVVDKDGRPLVVYHQTKADWDVYDKSKVHAGKHDFLTPTAIFTKSNTEDIGLGDIQMPLYSSIKNPLYFRNRDLAKSYFEMAIPGYRNLVEQIEKNDKIYNKQFDEVSKAESKGLSKIRESGNYTFPSKEWSAIVKDSHKNSEAILDKWSQENDLLSMEAKSLLDQFIEKSEYDGVVLRQDDGSWGRKTDSIISINPTQIKSATGNQGTFDAQNPNINFKIKPVSPYTEIIDGFYSPIENALNGISQFKGTADQFLGQIMKAPGVKKDELRWTGVQQWLESKGRESITKKELFDYMKENRVEIVEVVKGDRTTRLSKDDFRVNGNEKGIVAEGGGYRIEKSEDTNRAQPYDLYFGYEYIQENKSIDDAIERAIRDSRNKKATPSSSVKFPQYQLEGEKGNSKEVLVTLPVKKTKLGNEITNWYNRMKEKYGEGFNDKLNDQEKAEQERLSKGLSETPKNLTFKSSHFDEPNIISFI
jgi:DNA repair protein RadC